MERDIFLGVFYGYKALLQVSNVEVEKPIACKIYLDVPLFYLRFAVCKVWNINVERSYSIFYVIDLRTLSSLCHEEGKGQGFGWCQVDCSYHLHYQYSTGYHHTGSIHTEWSQQHTQCCIHWLDLYRNYIHHGLCLCPQGSYIHTTNPIIFFRKIVTTLLSTWGYSSIQHGLTLHVFFSDVCPVYGS